MDVNECIRRQALIEGTRGTWDSHCREIAERIWPAADIFQNHRRTEGEKRTEEMLDSTAALALEKFAAALESLLTPRTQKWHGLKSSNEDLNDAPGVEEWFERASAVLFSMRNAPRSGFYSQIHEGYKSLGAFGAMCTYIPEPVPGQRVRYHGVHVANVYVAADEAGQIDTVYRKYMMSAKAAAQKWNGKSLPPAVAKALEKGGDPFAPLEFLHCVYPKDDYDPERKDAAGMAYQSYDISIQDKHLIDEGGYHELPYLYSRYTVNANETTGRSPAMMVLPNIKVANEMQKTFLRAGHLVVEPPLLTYDDGVIGYGGNRVDLRSRAINRGGLDAQGRQLIQPMLTGGRLDLTETMIEREREVINEAFLVSLFRVLVDGPTITATEALIRQNEKGLLLAPTVGRQQTEYTDPLVNRDLHVAFRAGWLPPMPEALRESQDDYDIVYDSPASRFAESESVLGIQRTLEMALPLIQMKPEYAELFDVEEIIRRTREGNGAPAAMLHDHEDFQAALAKIQEQQAAQQQMAAMAAMAPAAKDMAAAQQMAGQGQLAN